MVSEEKNELKRVLCKIVELFEFEGKKIKLTQEALSLLEIKSKQFSSNYGLISLQIDPNLSPSFNIKLSTEMAKKIGISVNDFIDIILIDNLLYLIPIPSCNLISYFLQVSGSEKPRIILLSSHPKFERYTREIATRIHSQLQVLSIPSLRIEIQKHFIESEQKIDITLSRFEVDLTRNHGDPQIIAKKLVNKNPSYRIVAELYFQLLGKYLSSERQCVVVDIHGIAKGSSSGILHPMMLVGDALMRNPIVETFTNFIIKSSQVEFPNLWIVYRPPWGSVEYSLQLVKNSGNIPIIIEIRQDLRHDPKARKKIIDIITNALVKIAENLPLNEVITTKRIFYRQFNIEDLNDILFIYRQGYALLYGNEVKKHAEQFIELFQAALREGVEGEMFIAEKYNNLIGFAIIHKEASGNWKFGPIAVLPAKQNRGIGSHLLQLCINFARVKQVKQFYLKVHEHNQNAINLYKKFNFTIIDTVPSDLEGKKYLKMIYNL
ncbi:MAG TPA: GNAT family N-acetyltransferase [Candidatus Deferrimicrobium sp.]|nr:GNAT family N-acetyltransferase [Candidatus Deferrimicrobium sp.]